MISTLIVLAIVQQPEPALAHDLYRTQIFAAESALRLGEPAVARAWLDEVNPDQRGFEWRVHDAGMDESSWVATVDGGHAYAVDVSPDGTLIACGLSTGAIELRKTTDGALVATLSGHEESLSHLRFDRAGARLVSSSFDRTVKVWDVARRELLVDFKKHGFPVGGADFSPDGKLIASCSYERPNNSVVGTLHLWDAQDGTIVRTMEGGRKPLIGLAFAPDGQHIAAGSWDFCVFVWPLDGGAPVPCAVPDEGVYNAVDDVDWSPDSQFVAGASKDKTARVWKAANGELVATLRAHTDAVGAVAFAPDGGTLATSSTDGAVCLWRTNDWTLRARAVGHAGSVKDLDFAPDSQTLFSGSSDRTLRAWDATSRWYGGATMRADAAVYVARFSPDDDLIASCSYDGRIQIWSAATLDLLHSWPAHPSAKSCHALGWTSDGRRLVSGSWEPVVRVWDSATGLEAAALNVPGGTSSLAVAPNDRFVATTNGKQVTVFDLTTYTQVHAFVGHTATVMHVNFSPDSSRCVSAGRDGRALVWEAAAGALVHTIEVGFADVAEAEFTADGSFIVVASRNGHVALYDARDGQLVRTLGRSRHGIDHIEVSPDGSRVALAGDIVELFDTRRGRLVGALRAHETGAYNVDFDSTGTRLVSCATDKTIAVSDIRPLRERLVHSITARAARGRARVQIEADVAAGRSLASLRDEDVGATLDPAQRTARREALLLLAAQDRK